MKEEHFAILRRHMVEVIGIYVDLASDELGKSALDERVLTAMARVPRHAFVPLPLAPHAYQDMPLPIGFDKTISQPFIVAVMTDLLEVRPSDVVLEIGTGFGYQAAVLSQLARRVWSVEIIEELAAEAEARLRRLGCNNVGIRIGDGALGWAEHAPYDRIIVTAAAELVPPALIWAAQAARTDGAAHRPGRGTEVDGGREGCGGPDPPSRAHVREVRTARDGTVKSPRDCPAAHRRGAWSSAGEHHAQALRAGAD